MNKKGRWLALTISLALLVILVILIFLYFALFSPRYEKVYAGQVAEGKLVNPVTSLSYDDAVTQFNESFVYYLLFSIKAYNLHNPPLSQSKPVIQIYVGNLSYFAEIDNGVISIHSGETQTKDIIIRTSKEEAVKMLKSKEYVSLSFESGNSQIELIESKSTLFGKGYLTLYQELTGKSVTGNIIKIYTD